MPFLLLLLGLLPGFAWLTFYLEEETHAEPKRLILFTFMAGIAFAFFTVIVERWFNSATSAAGISEFSIISLVGLALIEEVMKLAAADFAISKTAVMRDPVDVMIYMIVAALGFATLENIGAIATTLPTAAAAAGAAGSAGGVGAATSVFLASVFQTISLRFVGATLLHSLTSGTVGYYWALGIARRRVLEYLAAGLAIATILHAFFNYLILSFGNVSYTVVFLVIVGFFVLNDFEKLKVAEGA
jgi:RsiW-degrading membrane proteinase PrsW (M82 family)